MQQEVLLGSLSIDTYLTIFTFNIFLVVANVPQKYGNVQTNRFHGYKLDGADKPCISSFGPLESLNNIQWIFGPLKEAGLIHDLIFTECNRRMEVRLSLH